MPDDRPTFFKGKFDSSYYRGKYELLPIICTVAFVLCGMTFVSLYFPFTKNDVEIIKGKKKAWDRIDILKPKYPKFLQFNDVYKPNTELARIYAAMENEEKKLKEKCKHDE